MERETRERLALGATGETGRGAPALLGHALLALTAVVWGSSFVGVKLALPAIPPMQLGLLRSLIGAGVLLGLARLSGEPLRPPRGAARLLALLGALGVGYFYIATNLGLKWASATDAALLGLPYPAITALAARILFHERIRPRRWAGIAVALAGAAFLTVATAHERAGGSLLGNLLVLSTTVAWTAYTLIGAGLFRRLPPLAATAWIAAAGAAVLLPAALLEAALVGGPRLAPRALGVTLYLGVVCTGLGYVWWNRGLEILGATRASVYLYLQPVAVALLAAPLLGERPTAATLVGGAIVVAGTALAARR